MTIDEVISRTSFGPGCWTWRGNHHRGRPVRLQREPRLKLIYIARELYEYFIEPLGERHTHHICDNIACVNPAHLEAVTPAEHNTIHKSQTVCKRGHGLTPENTYVYPNGMRQCRTCRRLRSKLGGADAIHLIGNAVHDENFIAL